jgi:23S rRNA (adenine2503-C2)-methyltransferase
VSYAPYRPIQEALTAEGFNVLVPVPSFDEADDLITCGNAIVGGSQLDHYRSPQNQRNLS